MFKERLKQSQEQLDDDQELKVQIQGDKELDEAAEILGLSSIKYYDLKQNRTQNYNFEYDKMLDPRGDTGVYLIYAYVRICSILRKVGYEEKGNQDKY